MNNTRDAIPPLGAAPGSASGTKSAITYVGSGTKGPHVIYLAEGKRITVGRDKSTKGPAWLVIEDTPVVKAQSPNAAVSDGGTPFAPRPGSEASKQQS